MSAIHQFHYSKIITPIWGALAKETILSKVIWNIDWFKIALTNIYEDTKKKYVDVIMKLDNMKTVMLDLKWPEFRSTIHTPLIFVWWERLWFEYSDFFDDQENTIFTDYPFSESLHVWVWFIFSWWVELEIVEIVRGRVLVVVRAAWTLWSQETMILADLMTTSPYLTEKDKSDMMRSITHNINIIVLSHVTHPQNIIDAKNYLVSHWAKWVKVFFKVQNLETIYQFKQIIDVADGVIVEPRAYGELTKESSDLQEKIFDMINCTSYLGKPAIVKMRAQELLWSKEEKTKLLLNYLEHGMSTIQLWEDIIDLDDPTELILEIYNIMFEHQFDMMKSIAMDQARITEDYKTTDYIVYSAFRAISEIDVRAIILYTENGYTAGMLSAYRPNIPIIAFTKSDAAYRYVNLMRAIRWYKIAPAFDYDNIKQLWKEIVRNIFKWSIALEDKILVVHASSLKMEISMINWLEIYKFKDI